MKERLGVRGVVHSTRDPLNDLGGLFEKREHLFSHRSGISGSCPQATAESSHWGAAAWARGDSGGLELSCAHICTYIYRLDVDMADSQP